MSMTAEGIVAMLRGRGCGLYLNDRGRLVIRHRRGHLTETVKEVVRRYRFRITQHLERERASLTCGPDSAASDARYDDDELKVLNDAGIELSDLRLVDNVKRTFPGAIVVAAKREETITKETGELERSPAF